MSWVRSVRYACFGSALIVTGTAWAESDQDPALACNALCREWLAIASREPVPPTVPDAAPVPLHPAALDSAPVPLQTASRATERPSPSMRVMEPAVPPGQHRRVVARVPLPPVPERPPVIPTAAVPRAVESPPPTPFGQISKDDRLFQAAMALPQPPAVPAPRLAVLLTVPRPAGGEGPPIAQAPASPRPETASVSALAIPLAERPAAQAAAQTRAIDSWPPPIDVIGALLLGSGPQPIHTSER